MSKIDDKKLYEAVAKVILSPPKLTLTYDENNPYKKMYEMVKNIR